MKKIILTALIVIPCIALVALNKDDIQKLDGPVTVSYLKKKLSKDSPKLILTPQIEKQLRKKVEIDSVFRNVYKAFQINAKEIQNEALLERELEGRRLLSVSRKMLYRMNILGIVYVVEKDTVILKRIDDELKAVCDFSDWNPSHFLDVAEMSMAVSLALDWTGRDLPESTVELAKEALINKAIKPGLIDTGYNWWVNAPNNWNQVCHAGLSAAAIIIAEEEPELAIKVINRALEYIPTALVKYGPDGAYPEGPMYWGYGTSFTVLTSSIFESAFGTDFGIAEYPAFKRSAEFYLITGAPSGKHYNYADCNLKRGKDGNFNLAWFAQKTGNAVYYNKEYFVSSPEQIGNLPRIAGAGLIWLAHFKETNKKELPVAWKGEGANPVVIFRGDVSDTSNFYFGGKGGKATVNHGNMDAGSFIFELDGVRWIIDLGKQGYHNLEKTGFELWGSCQECDRWKLISKNNFGHSLLTVNDELFIVDGFVPLINFEDGDIPKATFDLSTVYGKNLDKATRTFVKENNRSLLVEDQFELNDSTNIITWQLMTQADVELINSNVILKQDGKQLKIENLSHPDMGISVISLDPPPFELDIEMKGLKRLEFRYPAYLFPEGKGEIKVRISGESNF